MLRVERSYAFHVSRAMPELTGDQSLMLLGLDGNCRSMCPSALTLPDSRVLSCGWRFVPAADDAPDFVEALANGRVPARRQVLLPQDIVDRLMHRKCTGQMAVAEVEQICPAERIIGDVRKDFLQLV